jgi:hypothetical protein
MGLGIVLVAAFASAACPPVQEGVEVAVLALVDGADPGPGFAAAEASLACGPADGAALARLWLARGAALQLAGDESSAAPFYATARALAPEAFDDRLGPTVRASWEAATLGEPGRLAADRPLRVDGRRVARFPAELPSGPHALQAPEAAWGKVVVMLPGEELQVQVPRAANSDKKKSPLAAILGGVALAGAVGAGAGAIVQTDVMATAADTDALEAAWATQQGLGYGAVGLAALGASGIVLQFVLP